MYPVGGSKYLDIILLAVIELQVRDVDDVMKVCFVDSLSLNSVCENVCVFVQTLDEFNVVAKELFCLRTFYYYY